MNVKRSFGVVLTILGIVGLIYAAVVFMDAKGTTQQMKTLAVYGVLGAVFFFTGISLIRATADDARAPIGSDRVVRRETRMYRTDEEAN